MTRDSELTDTREGQVTATILIREWYVIMSSLTREWHEIMNLLTHEKDTHNSELTDT